MFANSCFWQKGLNAEVRIFGTGLCVLRVDLLPLLFFSKTNPSSLRKKVKFHQIFTPENCEITIYYTVPTKNSMCANTYFKSAIKHCLYWYTQHMLWRSPLTMVWCLYEIIWTFLSHWSCVFIADFEQVFVNLSATGVKNNRGDIVRFYCQPIGKRLIIWLVCTLFMGNHFSTRIFLWALFDLGNKHRMLNKFEIKSEKWLFTWVKRNQGIAFNHPLLQYHFQF